MIRDPFYRDIITRLSGPLDEEAFERCAQDLLRSIYPTLVPVRGGRDSGMDGVTAQLGSDQIVLIATVGQRVKRNLESSLDSMQSAGNTCRKIVTATSQKLSPEKQQELRDSAAKKGFRLVQVYEQAAMADLLYGSRKWCIELLNLSGDPSALSIIPRSTRPTITDQLIGRDEDAQWLLETPEDRLLVGQPGSGKTFLLASLARKHGWLFVTTTDLGRVASGIRSEKPTALLVDDAHLDPEFLMELTRLRREAGAAVPIIAACWPGAKDRIEEVLNLTHNQVRKLRPLTRPEVAEVLKSAGLNGPDRLIHQILNQAEGRPGLAITLAHLCLEGGDNDLENVVFGDALIRTVSTTFERLIGPLAIDLLAVLAVGGSAGMSLQAASDYLGKALAEVRHTASGLALGGVIFDVDGKHLSVRPPELRYALVRDVFFGGAISLDIAPLIAASPSISQSTETLIGACHYGAAVPTDVLRELLDRSDSHHAWESYAWLGAEQSRWALDCHPEMAVALSSPTLHRAPEVAIPLLLDEAVGDSRLLHSNPEHPMRLIEDWVKRGIPGSGEPMRRRTALLSAAKSWLTSGGETEVGLHAMSMVLDPSFRMDSTDPVLGNSVTFRWGLLTHGEIADLENLWPEILHAFSSAECPEWKHLIAAVSDWVYPQRQNPGSVDHTAGRKMRQGAERFLKDMARVGRAHRGLMHKVAELAKELEVDIGTARDEEFEILFPTIPTNWKEFSERHTHAVEGLAQRWVKDKPNSVIARIVSIEAEARFVDEHNRQTPRMAEELAKFAPNPVDWIRAIIASGAVGDIVAPFLSQAISVGTVGWELVASECLSTESTRIAAAQVLLALEDLQNELKQQTLQSLAGMSKHIEILCLRKAIPEENIGQLLAHDDDSIASHAAIGVWNADRNAPVSESLFAAWRSAVLRGNRNEYWIGEILKQNAELGFEFLRKELSVGPHVWSLHDHPIREAIKGLSADQRKQLLAELPDTFWSRDIVATIVDNDVELHRQLLENPRLEHVHLAPLGGDPNEGNWIELATAALDSGIDPESVAEASFVWGKIWSGKESEMWKGKVDSFHSLKSHTDGRIRAVAEAGIALFSSRMESAARRERDEETYGRP